MSGWDLIQGEVTARVAALESIGTVPLFRGHANSSWELRPGLARAPIRPSFEGRIYHLFTALGSPLIHHSLGAWERLYLMRHHGLPTRLLDWTENFATAVYFALEDATEEAAIWILDPFRLNEKSFGRAEILEPENDFPEGYDEYFFSEASRDGFPYNVVAMTPSRLSGRLLAQRGGFTFHHDLSSPLELLYPDCVRKVTVPKSAFNEARQFLSLAGVDHYSLFPDLDGLAKHLLNTER